MTHLFFGHVIEHKEDFQSQYQISLEMAFPNQMPSDLRFYHQSKLFPTRIFFETSNNCLLDVANFKNRFKLRDLNCLFVDVHSKDVILNNCA